MTCTEVVGNRSRSVHNVRMELKQNTGSHGIYIATGSPQTANPQVVTGGFHGQVLRVSSMRTTRAGR